MLERSQPLGTFSSVKGLVFRDDGRLLVLHRSLDDPNRPGMADLPGGAVREGEDFGQAVRREVAEETGIDVETQALDMEPVWAGTEVHPRFGDNALRIFYRIIVGRTVAETITLSDEHSGHEWVPPDRARALLVHPPHATALAHLARIGMLQSVVHAEANLSVLADQRAS